MAQPIWVREYLKNLGAKDEEIGYSGGTVTYKNKPFYYTSPTQGKAYGTQPELDAAYNSYQQNELLNQYKSNVTQQPQPFTYDVNQIRNSPEYQAGYNTLLQDAQSATNQSLVNLGRRGIGNSQSAVVSANAQQQNVVNQANNVLLPRMIAEQYKKYVDQNEMTRQRNQDILGLAGTYGNQAAGYREEGRLQQEAAANALESERKATSDAEQAAIDNLWKVAEQTGTLPNELAALYGLPQGTSTLEAQRVGISRMNAQTSSRNAGTSAGNLAASQSKAQFSRLMDIWKATGKAPAGIQGVTPGTAWQDAQTGPYNKAMQQAVNLAQKDDSFFSATPEERQKMIDYYYKMIAPSQPQGGTISDDDIMKYLK